MNNYISAEFDFDNDRILVWERPCEGGARALKIKKPPRYFYVPDQDGAYISITGVKLKKLQFETAKEFKSAERTEPVKFESDVSVTNRTLMDDYYGAQTPVIHYAFYDIETDYRGTLGFSSPENPYARINAITIYQAWLKKYITCVVPPENFDLDVKLFKQKVQEIAKEKNINFVPEIIICKSEKELLLQFLTVIEDADIISGWNSDFFDNPYIIKRIRHVLGEKSVQRMCFPGTKKPTEKMVNRFGSPALTYVLHGRTHLDYLDIFKKFTYGSRVSYSLANIAAEELDIPKLTYNGTLEELYKGAYRPTKMVHDDRMDQLNSTRELIRQEIEKRGLTI